MAIVGIQLQINRRQIMAEREVYQMRVRHETKLKLEQLKKKYPDDHWDKLLKPLIDGIHVPRNRCDEIIQSK
jgi:hypothetical protein